MSAAPPGEGAFRRSLRIVNKRGLHARAAAKLAKLAGNFQAEITVGRGDIAVSARSIMGLMMLAAAQYTDIELAATGPDADAALDAIALLVARGFDEL